jgi:hypothetical protein
MLGFSVFTSRLLAMGLSQSHWHFKSHVMSSLHCLIPLLPLFCSCQFQRLDYCSLLFKRPLSLYNPSARTPWKTLSSVVKDACLQLRCLAIDVLLFCVFASVGMCLPSRCLAMGIHVTVYSVIYIYHLGCVVLEISSQELPHGSSSLITFFTVTSDDVHDMSRLALVCCTSTLYMLVVMSLYFRSVNIFYGISL